MLLLLACTQTVDIQVEDTAVELTPSPYISDQQSDVEPALSVTDVEGALAEFVSVLMDLDAQPILDGYQDAMVGQQTGCPDYYESEGNVYWYDYCYADDGTYFNGYGFWYDYVDYPDEGYLYNGSQLYAVAEIVDGNGYTFEGGGGAQMLRADHPGDESNVMHTLWYSVINGSFSYDGPAAEDTWMAGGLTPDLTLYVAEIPEEAGAGVWGNTLSVEGGVSGLGGTANTVVVDQLQMWPAVFGNPCEEEPHGTISVRDADGLWYDVVFDGAEAWTDETVVDAVCDGCGTVWFRGEDMGQACLDWTGLNTFEGDSPW